MRSNLVAHLDAAYARILYYTQKDLHYLSIYLLRMHTCFILRCKTCTMCCTCTRSSFYALRSLPSPSLMHSWCYAVRCMLITHHLMHKITHQWVNWVILHLPAPWFASGRPSKNNGKLVVIAASCRTKRGPTQVVPFTTDLWPEVWAICCWFSLFCRLTCSKFKEAGGVLEFLFHHQIELIMKNWMIKADGGPFFVFRVSVERICKFQFSKIWWIVAMAAMVSWLYWG